MPVGPPSDLLSPGSFQALFHEMSCGSQVTESEGTEKNLTLS